MNHEELESLLLEAKELADTDPDQALRICNDIMNGDMTGTQGARALFMFGYVMMQAERFGIAYHIFERCAQMNPRQSAIYNNMGMCLEDHDEDASMACFEKAMALDPTNAACYANKALILLQKNKADECIEFCNKALEINPNNKAAHHNRALAKLMQYDWSGFEDFNETIGSKHRKVNDYGVPDWDYKTPGKILVFGEQGIGDEIMFASILPDMIKAGYDFVYDGDGRLEGLFKRSFDVPVYGTRFASESNIRNEHDIDFQVPIGNLMHMFRKKDADFPGTAYLKPDPERCLQWRSLFDTFKGKKIGLAWNGGQPHTLGHKRSATIEDFEPIFNDEDTFISLEYKPVPQEILDKYGIKAFNRATRKGEDIDELAALVHELDYVVTVCTSGLYVSGAVGTKTYVLVPSEPVYRYHPTKRFPWYNCVELIRQGKGESWRKVINRARKFIKKDNVRSLKNVAS